VRAIEQEQVFQKEHPDVLEVSEMEFLYPALPLAQGFLRFQDHFPAGYQEALPKYPFRLLDYLFLFGFFPPHLLTPDLLLLDKAMGF